MRTDEAPQDAGFRIGTSSSSLTDRIVYTEDILSGANGSYSAVVSSLAPSKKYYYQAFMTVSDGNGGYTEIVSTTIGEFTTLAQGQAPQRGWLELPAVSTGSGFIEGNFGTGKSRNYSYHYDTNMYTALWTAYPLTASHISGSASSTTWYYNPNVDENIQINVKGNSYGTNYNNSTYSRGHQLPAADRKCNADMRKETYYLTNQTPQIQNQFNSPMWSNLEEAVRGLTSSTDTVYVVTGAAFQKVGETKNITYLNATSSTIKPSSIPVPNYYWKVLLKVKRTGGTITSASAIGIWMEHKTYSNTAAWQNATYSVKQIQDWTGFDFFVNLLDGIETTAENNSDWTTFQNF